MEPERRFSDPAACPCDRRPLPGGPGRWHRRSAWCGRRGPDRSQARHGRDARFQQQALRESGAVHAQVADVGVDIEGAVRLDRHAQSQTLEFGQQVVAALLEGSAAVREGLERVVGEAGQRGVLGQRGRADGQAGGDLLDRLHHVVEHDHPAQAPAGHVEVLGEAVDDDDVVVQRQRRARLAFIGQPQVDLVDDGEAVAGAPGPAARPARRARSRCRWDCWARPPARPGWRASNVAPRPGRTAGSACRRCWGSGAARRRRPAQSCCWQDRRVGHEHFAAGVDQCGAGQRQGAGGAGGHDHAPGIDAGAELVEVEAGDGLAQRGQPAVGL